MKLLHLFTALSLIAAPAFAADPKKPDAKKPEAKKAEPKKPGLPPRPTPAPPKQKTDMIDEEVVALLKPYDTNSDFEIDVEEFKAVEAAFKKEPKGPLKAFDKGHDGALDAMIDRTGINVKLGSAAPKKKPAAPAKKAVPPKPAGAPAPPVKPAEKKP